MLLSDASEFDNVPNPCGSASGRIYFPHPTDPTKFLQCSSDRKLMIVQCPVGERFNMDLTACMGSVATSPASQPTPPVFTGVPGFPNPCVNNPNNQILFANPKDRSHFIVCDVFGRMYIMPCRNGQLFNLKDKKCEPTLANPSIGPGVIKPDSSNPCKMNLMAVLPNYYAFQGDNNKFIECDLLGNAIVLTCPAGLDWSESQVTCVFPLGLSVGTGTGTGMSGTGTGTSGTGTGTGTTTGTGTSTNPCSPQAIATGVLFYEHPNKNQFYQCDLWGDVFVGTCPTRLRWNNNLKTCAGRFGNKK